MKTKDLEEKEKEILRELRQLTRRSGLMATDILEWSEAKLDNDFDGTVIRFLPQSKVYVKTEK